MRLLSAALLLLAPCASLAQTAPSEPAPTAATRFINGEQLGQPAPRGIAEYAARLRQLDVAMQPYAVKLRTLSTQINAAREKQAQAERNGNKAVADTLGAEIRTLMTEAQQVQTDGNQAMQSQHRSLVAPVMARIGQAARRYGSLKGLADLRFANGAAEVKAMQAAGATDVTGDFATWYAANPMP